MKSILLTFLALALLATLSHGQTKGVLKNITGNTITESLTFPSGTTLTISAGATINATGATITGFGSGGGASSLDDLTDVTITTVATNDFLVKGASAWVNLTAANARTAMGLGTLATQSGTISDYLTTATAASTYAPLAHNQAWSTITDTPTTLAGYGITDAINNVSGGFNGLSGDNLVLTDASVYFEHDPGSGTTTSQLTIAALTAARTWSLPDVSGTLISTGNLSAITATGTITSGTWNGSIIAPAYLGTGSSITTKYLRGDGTWQTISGGGDALTSGSLDQFADVTQTATKTLAITESTTLAGGTHSGTNTGDQTTITGNAGTATALQTGRTINGTTFDGTANITVTAAAGTLTGATLNSGVTASSLTSLGTIATGVWQGTAIADSYISSAATWNAKQAAISFGTGVQTALGVNIGSAGAPVLFDGAGGTPSSITLTNASGTASSLTAGQATAALGIKTATTTVAVDSATAPSSGQVLTATSSTAATWQTPSGGGSGGSTNLFLSAAAMIPRTTSGAGVNSTETTTNKINIDTLQYDAGADEFAQILIVMPDNWDAGTVTAKAVWTADSGSGAVVWTISGRAFADDDAIDQAMGTGQSVTDTLTATGDMHVSSATSAITFDGTPTTSTPIVIQISRDADNGSDTLATDARLIGVIIEFN